MASRWPSFFNWALAGGDAIKARLTAHPQPRPHTTLKIVPRPQALAPFRKLQLWPGLHGVVGPRGEGKSALVQQYIATQPHVIYANLQCVSLSSAVGSVARALGWEGTGDTDHLESFDRMLSCFKKASEELLSEGQLQAGCCPVLILDHANVPLQGVGMEGTQGPISNSDLDAPPNYDIPPRPYPPRNSLMHATLNFNPGISNKLASVVMVSSGVLPEEEAKALLSNLIHTTALNERQVKGGRDLTLTPLDLQRDHASTISTIISVLGTRAKWLMESFHRSPLSDADLPLLGVPFHTSSLPYLPLELQEGGQRVDPRVRVALEGRIQECKARVDSLLSLPPNFTLPSISQGGGCEEEVVRTARRIQAVHSILHALLAGPMPYHDLRHRNPFLAGKILKAMEEREVVFFDHSTNNVELDSPLMHRVVAAMLTSPLHTLSMQLLGELQQWREAEALEGRLAKDLSYSTASTTTTTSAQLELSLARENKKRLLAASEVTRGAFSKLLQHGI